MWKEHCMDHNSAPQPTFLQAFFGSFSSPSNYPKFAQRTLASAFGHFLLLVTLVCSLYAGLASYWLKVNVSPYLNEVVAQIPSLELKDGVVSTDLPQPHIISLEETPVLIIDTTREPSTYLQEYPSIMVLSANHFTTKDSNGTVESHTLDGDFQLDSARVGSWLELVASWTLPILFLCVAAWQLSWKAVQVLLVAGIVTIINKSRPDFSTHLRLACYALSPAMAWGLLVFLVSSNGIMVPFSGLVFWMILGGATAMAAAKIRTSPRYH